MRKAISYGLCASALVTAAPLYAQTPELGGNAPAEASTRIEDIVVTARRREERLQAVPVSITALSTDTLERLGIQEPDKLQDFVPNLASTASPTYVGGTVNFIRGVGTSELLLSVDSPIATYVDGVYLGRNILANLGVISPERAEVLRGPQGTLFGRNTTGGAISLTTPTPKKEFAAELKGGIASFHERYGQVRLDSGEIGNTGLRAIIAYQHKESHGYIDNPLAPGPEDPGARNSDAVFAKVHGEWGSLRVDYSFDYVNLHAVAGAFQIGYATQAFKDYYANSPGLGGAELIIDPVRRDVLPYRRLGRQSVETYGHTFTAALDLSDAFTVKSITAYRNYESVQPVAYAPPGILGLTPNGVAEVYPFQSDPNTLRHQDQFSQEVQLLGTFDEFDFVVGGFYFHEYADDKSPTSYTYLIAPELTSGMNLAGATNYAVTADSYAVFGQGNYRPAFANDRLEITLGARYTKDKKYVNQTRAQVRSDERKYDNFSYNASLSYKVLPETMVFGRIGTGYRSGGFNARAGAGVDFVFKPEKVTSYELGLKSDWLGGMLRTNLAAFYTDYSDLQVSQYTGGGASGGTGFTRNANATLKGFELEAAVLPVAGLRLEGSVGYVQARFDQIFFPSPATGELTNYASISHLPYVPAWTTHTSAQYDFGALANGIKPSVRVDYSWRSRRWFHTNNLSNMNPFNDSIADAPYGLLGARFIVSEIPLGGATGQVSVWGENLTDTVYKIQGVDFGAFGFAGNTFGTPRRFGVDLKVNF